MADPTCQTCAFFVGDEFGASKRRQCRAQPPTFAAERPTADGGHEFLGAWPRVLPTDWCGAYRAGPSNPTPTDGTVIDSTDPTATVVAQMGPPAEGVAKPDLPGPGDFADDAGGDVAPEDLAGPQRAVTPAELRANPKRKKA